MLQAELLARSRLPGVRSRLPCNRRCWSVWRGSRQACAIPVSNGSHYDLAVTRVNATYDCLKVVIHCVS